MDHPIFETLSAEQQNVLGEVWGRQQRDQETSTKEALREQRAVLLISERAQERHRSLEKVTPERSAATLQQDRTPATTQGQNLGHQG